MSSLRPEMPFGKHRGLPLTEIDSSYLVWVLEEARAVSPTLRAAIRDELADRFRAAPTPSAISGCPDPVAAAEVISAGLHTLARAFHPDAGGTNAAMTRINLAADWLRKAIR